MGFHIPKIWRIQFFLKFELSGTIALRSFGEVQPVVPVARRRRGKFCSKSFLKELEF